MDYVGRFTDKDDRLWEQHQDGRDRDQARAVRQLQALGRLGTARHVKREVQLPWHEQLDLGRYRRKRRDIYRT